MEHLTSIIGFAGGVLGIISWAMTWRDRIRKAASGVSVHLDLNTALDDHQHSADIVVRNDGELPVTVTQVLLGENAILAPWDNNFETFNESRAISLDSVGEPIRLIPGAELRYPVKENELWRQDSYSSLTCRDTPEVQFIDHDGRDWAFCDGFLLRMKGESPRNRSAARVRRHYWFERKRAWEWFERNASLWIIRVTNSRENRRPPLLIYFFDWLWGWRLGSTYSSPFPLGAPRAWHWADLIKDDPMESPNDTSNEDQRDAPNLGPEGHWQ